MARQSMVTLEMLAAFGAPKRIEPGARTMTERQFKFAVRGEPVPVEEAIAPRPRGTLKLRCGHGAR